MLIRYRRTGRFDICTSAWYVTVEVFPPYISENLKNGMDEKEIGNTFSR